MSHYTPLSVHSDYSLLRSSAQVHQIAKRCKEVQARACVLSDLGSISGIPSFSKVCKDVCVCGEQPNRHQNNKGRSLIKGSTCSEYHPEPIKTLFGCEFYTCQEHPTVKYRTESIDSKEKKIPVNRELSRLIVISKNLAGWKALIKAVSASNKKDYVDNDKPRHSLQTLREFSQHWIGISGYPFSSLGNSLFEDIRSASKAKTVEECASFLHKDYIQIIEREISVHRTIFENFYLGVYIDGSPLSLVLAKINRWAAKKFSVPAVALTNAYYPRKEDATDQRILLSTYLNTPLSKIADVLSKHDELDLENFVHRNAYYIPTYEEMASVYTKEELDNTNKIAESVEDFKISSPPSIPEFPVPPELGLTPLQYLNKLCQDGWKKKMGHITKEKYKEYGDRVKMELGVIGSYDLLVHYFLIAQDYMKWARKRMLCGPGRGSASGCLISHLLDITNIDSLKYGLLFSRFYNSGRNSPGRVALPDIDSDFPINRRDEVVKYLQEKWGHDKICQMTTFGRMQGRSALKDVLRAYESCSFTEMNQITEFIPDEAAITDKLQEMKDDEGESSIIEWALENNKGLETWCKIGKNGELEGPLAQRFAQAIRLEGTKRSRGKHASGFIISPISIGEISPLSESDEFPVALYDMGACEDSGLVKIDLLGLACLDKISLAAKLVKRKKIK